MKDTKPKPRATKLPLREPAKPLAQPEVKPPSPDHPIFNLIGPAKAAETPGTHHPPPTTDQPPTAQPVAPSRDYVRVPNSVVRDALPAGLFKGESKKTYDALYQRTRGSVVPKRMTRATLADIMAWAGVSHNTLKAHLKHLSRVGLVKVHYVRGDNTGAGYEVFTPEEASPTTHQPPTGHPQPSSQNLAPPTSQNLVLGGGGQTIDFQKVEQADKTSFKTNTERDDDEAFADLVSLLKQAAEEVTGKGTTPAERERWREVAELLVTELKVAASRTSVTSAAAFLAEHLRRRLRKTDARQIEREVVEASTKQPPGDSKPELTTEQIQEQVNLMTGLMRDGAEMRELEEQFAANYRPSQWHMIRSIALAQANAPAQKD